MYFSNEFLYDFKPVYEGILAAKSVKPECAIVEVIDEEPDGAGMFEPAGTLDVLEQIGDELNALTIYTDRPAYFHEFAETMYEKTGLVSLIVSKKRLGLAKNKEKTAVFYCLILNGTVLCMKNRSRWENIIFQSIKNLANSENLDIAVPIGYNTVIVKRPKKKTGARGRTDLRRLFIVHSVWRKALCRRIHEPNNNYYKEG